MSEEQLKNLLSPALYERYSNLTDENKQIFINNLQNQLGFNSPNNLVQNNETAGQEYGGRIKILSNMPRPSSTEQEETIAPVPTTENKTSKFDNAAFIDVLILAGITAFFGLFSFLIIVFNYFH